VHKIKKEAAIFFDRDGVLIDAPLINKKPTSVQSLKDVKLCKNILEICKYYKKNYYLIMVTNQPDYSRGVNSKKNIININNFLKKKLNLDMIYVCYSDNEKCIDRKPNPGMLLKAKKKYKINLKKSFMIGDRWRDVGAGNKAGCRTIFIERNYSEKLIYKPNYSIRKLKDIFLIIKK
jgi:D-glycero-D-manno-heptose 1,7-bisphosphate phosphatase